MGCCSADRLAALLMFLEQHSSPESIWRWKVHCKTHKKLKEQARYSILNLRNLSCVSWNRGCVNTCVGNSIIVSIWCVSCDLF